MFDFFKSILWVIASDIIHEFILIQIRRWKERML